jgi:hypothetical protein
MPKIEKINCLSRKWEKALRKQQKAKGRKKIKPRDVSIKD